MGFWLPDDGIGLAAIGFVSWVGLTYTVKFVWGALVDRIKAPALSARSADGAAGCCSARWWPAPA